MDKMGIYKIVNQRNGKVYIGSTTDFRRRRIRHFGNLKRGQHANPHLQSAYRLYGEEAFFFQILELVSDESNLIDREQYYIDLCQAANREKGYNIYPYANGSRHSEETKRRMSLAQMGNKKKLGFKDSAETRRKKSEAMKGKYDGRKLPPSHCQAISKGLKGHGGFTNRAVDQLSLSGELIATYPTIKEAQEKTASRNVSEVCQGKRKSSNGFYWRYSNG